MVIKGKVTKKKRTIKPPSLPKKSTNKETVTNKTVVTTDKTSTEKKVEAKTLLKEYVLRPPVGTDTYYSVDVFETLEPESEVDKSEANKSTNTTTGTDSGTNSTNTSTTSTATDSSSTSTSSGSTNSTDTTSSGVSTTGTTGTTSTDTTSTEDTEEESDDDGFTLHTGKILKTHTYKKMYSIDWDHDYTDSTGSGKLTFEYSKDYLKYFYKGVRLLVKQYWKYLDSYQTLEDVRLKTKETALTTEKAKLKEIVARIKKDNAEASKTNDTSSSTSLTGTGKTSTDSTSKNSTTDTTSTTTTSDTSTSDTSKTTTDTTKTKTTSTTTEINIPENPTTANDSILGFITDSSISNDGIEVTLSDYGKMLEEKKELTYSQKKRSEIVENVIANAGLIPVVDFTGLTDDVIDWTSVTATGNNGGGTVGEASTSYTQCSRTYDLAGSLVSSGSVPTLSSGDERIKTIGKSGTNYASACSGKSIQEVMSILRNGWHYCYYSDNRDNCATDSWNNKVSKGLNCGDSSRLLKCCMDVAGHPCICVHTSGHYYNAVQVNGQWLTVDLCHSSTIKSKSGTNKLGY